MGTLANYRGNKMLDLVAAAAPTIGDVSRAAMPYAKRFIKQKATDWWNSAKARRMKRRAGPAKNRRMRRSMQPKQRLVQTEPTGGYTQWETERKKTSLNKYRTTKLTRALKMLQAQRERVIYRWNGVKNFDDNGYYWLSNKVNGTNRDLPLYTYDLTSVINFGSNVTLPSQPLSQMFQNINGDIFFASRNNLGPDGNTTTAELGIEQSPNYLNNSSFAPFNRSYLRWASIKMNLWGCKNRSTKFTIQLVRYNDEDIVPTHISNATTKRTSVFQNIIKSKAFNPISTSGAGLYKKDVKILKSETFIIQPTANYEVDTDPHVKTVNWFCRMDKLINYIQNANKLTTPADTADQADYVQNLGQQNDAYANPKARVYLVIMATNFGLDVADTNADTPSFDLSVRTCHEKFN